MKQYDDNLRWIRDAAKNKLVVGSQARILYTDMRGRFEIALAFNDAIKSGKISAPVILSRDHHDVSGKILIMVNIIISITFFRH